MVSVSFTKRGSGPRPQGPTAQSGFDDRAEAAADRNDPPYDDYDDYDDME